MAKIEQILGVSLGLLIIGSPVWLYIAMLAYEASPYAKEKDTRREFSQVISKLSDFCMGDPDGYPKLRHGTVSSLVNPFKPIEGLDKEKQTARHVGSCITDDHKRASLISSKAANSMAVEIEALAELEAYPDYIFNFQSSRTGAVSPPKRLLLAVRSEEDLWERGARSILACTEDSLIMSGIAFREDDCAHLSHIPNDFDFLELAQLCEERCDFEGQFYDDGTISRLTLRSLATSPADMDAALLFWDGELVGKIEQTRKEIEKIEPKSPEVWQELLDLSGLN